MGDVEKQQMLAKSRSEQNTANPGDDRQVVGGHGEEAVRIGEAVGAWRGEALARERDSSVSGKSCDKN